MRCRTPGSSVSNRGPLVAGRRGQYLGHCIQLMMSVYTAVQDAHKPNGSVNGIRETGRMTCGNIRLDPIMTEVWRCYGLETHEEGPVERHTACSLCGKLLVSGLCGCTDAQGRRAPQRPVNLNPGAARLFKHLNKMNTDVKVQWMHPEAAVEDEVMKEVPPESALWEAVPRDRGKLTMLDAQRKHWLDRAADRVTCAQKVMEGRCMGLLFQGNPPAARVLADQFTFAMRSSGRRAVWDSGDHSEGYLVVASEGARAFTEALREAAAAVITLRDLLDNFLHGPQLCLNSFCRSLDGRLALGVEVGGTLQLQTSDERMKHAAIGVTGFAHSAKRVHRAYLVDAPDLELLPLSNPGYAPKETCNEQELRSEFQRNVLGYLYLATTLATLPLRRHVKKESHPRVLEAELRFDTGAAHVAASHIFFEGQPVFFKDVVLGANPLQRGWCTERRLVLKFVVHEES